MTTNQDIEKFMQDFLNQQKEAQNLVNLRLERAYKKKDESVDSKIKDKTRYFKSILLENGFFEPTHFVEHKLWKWKYYKKTLEDVAFIVNLEPSLDYIDIYYGFASTAFTKLTGSENHLVECGVETTSINFRNLIRYKIGDDEESVRIKIKDFYDEYLSCSKDEILS